MKFKIEQRIDWIDPDVLNLAISKYQSDINNGMALGTFRNQDVEMEYPLDLCKVSHVVTELSSDVNIMNATIKMLDSPLRNKIKDIIGEHSNASELETFLKASPTFRKLEDDSLELVQVDIVITPSKSTIQKLKPSTTEEDE